MSLIFLIISPNDFSPKYNFKLKFNGKIKSLKVTYIMPLKIYLK